MRNLPLDATQQELIALCTPFGRVTQVRARTHAQHTRAHTHTHTYTRTHAHTRSTRFLSVPQVLLMNTKPQAFVEFEAADSAARLLSHVAQVRWCI